MKFQLVGIVAMLALSARVVAGKGGARKGGGSRHGSGGHGQRECKAFHGRDEAVESAVLGVCPVQCAATIDPPANASNASNTTGKETREACKALKNTCMECILKSNETNATFYETAPGIVYRACAMVTMAPKKEELKGECFDGLCVCVGGGLCACVCVCNVCGHRENLKILNLPKLTFDPKPPATKPAPPAPPPRPPILLPPLELASSGASARAASARAASASTSA